MMTPGFHRANKDTLDWPALRLIGPRRFELLDDYVVEWQAGDHPRQRLIVPKGFECDGASIPAALEWYLGRDRILPAAVPHDWQYAFGGLIPRLSHLHLAPDGEWLPADFQWSRKDSDRFFARNLRFCHIRDHQRRNAYRAVRVAGWLPWRRAVREAALRPA